MIADPLRPSPDEIERIRRQVRQAEEAERDQKLADLIDRFASRPVRRPGRDRPDIERWVHK